MKAIYPRRQYSHLFLALLWLGCLTVSAAAGQAANPGLAATAKSKVAGEDASTGIALNGTTDIQDNVEVQAVLLTREPAQRIFGKEIARNYAIVQVTISNQSTTSQLVLQSVSLDYSDWLMSGLQQGEAKGEDCLQSKSGLAKSFQRTCATRVASVEARVIRGELQDASTWTPRNGLVRTMVLVGSVATGFSFLGPTGFLQAVNGFNGNVIPGVATFWPDQTLPQINRVSDFGFQTNKVIPKDNSDIVYAFFPVDRFLTPGLKKIFLSSPALFFAPFELFTDNNIVGAKSRCKPSDKGCVTKGAVNEFKKELEETVGIPTDKGPDDEAVVMPIRVLLSQCLADEASCKAIATMPDGKDASANLPTYIIQAKLLWKLLSSISLSKINVLVGGVMTADVSTVPASVKRVTFEKTDQDVFSKACNPQTGTIEGQFLSNGVPGISSITVPGASDPKSIYYNKKIEDFLDSIIVVPAQSNDLGITFQMQLKNPIPPKSVLNFNVTKYDKGDTKQANPIKSADLPYTVSDYTPAPVPPTTGLSTAACKVQSNIAGAPKIDKVNFTGTAADWAKAGGSLSGTITGSGLTNGTPSVSKITLANKSTPDVTGYVVKGDITPVTTGSTDTTLLFTLNPTNVIPVGATLSFTVTTQDKAGTNQTSDAEDYKTPAAAAPAAPAPKPKAAPPKVTPAPGAAKKNG
jgi:hypothetical protein